MFGKTILQKLVLVEVSPFKQTKSHQQHVPFLPPFGQVPPILQSHQGLFKILGIKAINRQETAVPTHQFVALEDQELKRMRLKRIDVLPQTLMRIRSEEHTSELQ